MRRSLLALVAVLAVVFSGACGGGGEKQGAASPEPIERPTASMKLSTFVAPQAGLEFRHPAQWKQVGDLSGLEPGTFVAFAPGKNALFSVAVTDATGTTIEDYSSATLGRLNQDALGEIVGPDPARFGDTVGREVILDMRRKGKPMRVLQAWTVRNSKAYIVTYEAPGDAFNAHVVDVSNAVRSVEFRP